MGKKKTPKAGPALRLTKPELKLLGELLNVSLDDTLEWHTQLAETASEAEYTRTNAMLLQLKKKVEDLQQAPDADVLDARHAVSVLYAECERAESAVAVPLREAANLLDDVVDVRAASRCA